MTCADRIIRTGRRCYPLPHAHHPAWLGVKPYRVAFLLVFEFRGRP